MSGLPKDLPEVTAVLRALHRRNRVDESTLFKGLLSIAYEWAQLDDREEALSLVAEVTPSYITSEMATQMAGDVQFHELVIRLAHYLDGTSPGDADEDDATVQIALLGARSGADPLN